MKTLVEYIKESIDLNESKDSKVKNISFNFSGLNNTEDFLKSFDSFDCADVEEDTVNVNVSNSEECEKVFELIQDFVHARKNDQKVASDESYAQKVHSLEDKLSTWRNFIDDLEEKESEKESEENTSNEEDNDKKEEE